MGNHRMAKHASSRGFFSRHKSLSLLVAVALLLVAGCGAYALYLNSQLDKVPKIALDTEVLVESQRPVREPVAGKAMNILLAGTDNGTSGSTLSDAVASGAWDPGEFRSDTVMVVHLDATRQHVYVVSIPRDIWVPIDGIGMSKLNAAFSYGGPSLLVRTVEELTKLRIDHVAMIDWAGFKDLTTALGGVQVYIPETFYDTSQKREWKKGYQTLAGQDALQYVRTRYDLPSENGDFGRINRQQNFLRQVLHDAMSSGTLTNPIRLANVLRAITSNLTVDDDFSTGDMRSLALQLRGIGSKAVTFMTAPLRKEPYGTSPDGQSIVLLDKREGRALWRSMRVDDVESYLAKYGGNLLPPPSKVN